jgi:acyl-CoA synthetase (AMP-forming)/AMP-acid ligase II
MPPVDTSSLVALLRLRAERHGDRRAFTFLADGYTESAHVTYSELDQRARVLAAWLQASGTTGARALLLYPSGLDFVTAFFGCLYAGAVAVPTAPPHPARPARSQPRLGAIARDAEADFVLTTTAIARARASLVSQAPELGRAAWLSTDEEVSAASEDWRQPKISGDTLAFLQYTSGSTAAPRGVMVSHANLLHNLRFGEQATVNDAETVSVSWLPVHHDMGLIEGLLGPIAGGYPAYLMPPGAFLQRPLRWLETISRVRATKSGGPNFAYDLCVRRTTPDQRRSLDLRSWCIAYNGAEPVRAETLHRFHAAFRSAGFRWQAFWPVYGLAEATLAVSSDRRGDGPHLVRVGGRALAVDRIVDGEGPDIVSLPACGRPPDDLAVVIADPATLERCAPDRVGEIWVAGPSVAQGYWRRPDLTVETFGARLADTGEGPYLRTGDLGFLRDGRLVVTGRLKDIIIVRGKKHYPHDLELTVETSHPSLRPGGCAAFAVDGPDEDALVVVAEIESRRAPDEGDRCLVEECIAAVRQALSEEHGLQAHAIVLIAAGSLPRTTSGKRQRLACRAAWRAGSLPVVSTWTRTPHSAARSEPMQEVG